MGGILVTPETGPNQRSDDSLHSLSSAMLRISVGLTLDGPVIALAGELDVSTAPAVKTVCFDAFNDRISPHVVVDVAGLSFCDYSGLSAFLDVRDQALAGGGWVRLCRAGPPLQKVLGIMGLMSILRCYPTAADAFADVEPSASDGRGQECS